MQTIENIEKLAAGIEDQLFALGKLAENLSERMRRQEQNWNLAKKQMQLLQIQINKMLPDEDKLPPDWLDQIEMVREVINLHLNPSEKAETEVQND